MKNLKYLFIGILALCSFVMNGQSAALNVALKFQIGNPGSTGTNPTFTMSGFVSDDLGRWDASNVQVGDSLYAINGSDLAVCVVTTINTAAGNSLNITVTCGDPLVGGIDAGQAAIIHPTSEFKYPTYISGLRDDLRSMIMNRLTQRIDEGIRNAQEVAFTTGTGVPASTVATVQGYRLAKNNLGDGDLYQWNGITWVLVGGSALTFNDTPTIDFSGTSTVTADVKTNSLDSTHIKVGGLELEGLSRDGATTGQVIGWDGTNWVPKTITDVPSANIYYVGKKFTGLANTSNTDYVSQLASATRGSTSYPFPDPWSALSQAKIDLAATTITKALIYVLPGQEYTYGDATSSNNGQTDFTTTAFIVDKQVTLATKADVLLNFPNVDYYFSEGSKLANHCKAYPVPLFDITGTTKEVLNVFGKGNFYNYFGESVSVEAQFLNSSNKNAEVYFQANSVNMQQWHVFKLTKVRTANIDVSNITTGGAMIAEFNNENVADTVTINFKADIVKSGEGFFGPYVDYWYGMLLQNGGPTYCNIDIGQVDYKESGSFVRTTMTMTNSIVNINIGNAKHKIGSLGYLGGSDGCFIDISNALTPTGMVSEQNNQFNVKIGNYVGDYPVLRYSGLAKASGAANNFTNFDCGNCLTTGTNLPAILIVGGAGFGNVNPQANILKLTGEYRAVQNQAIVVSAVTGRVEIDATLTSDMVTGVWSSGAVNVGTIVLNGAIKPTVSNVLFVAGSTTPIIGNLVKWDNELKKYIVVQSSLVSKTNYDINRLPAISKYDAGTGLSANESRVNYEFNDVDLTPYEYSNGPLGTGGEYGGWLANGTSGDSISVSTAFGVVIGDSQAAGQPGNGTSRLHPSGASTFSPNLQDTYGTISYTLRQKTNMRWFNHGIGNQNSTQIKNRWGRDVLAQTVNVGDGRGSKTLQRKPNFVVVVAGANDVSQGVPLTTVYSNLLYMAKSARDNGIQAVFLNCPGDTNETAINYRRMDSLNLWMASGILQSQDASVVDYNKWWKNPTYNDNKHAQSLIVDNIHPSSIGYDSLANVIFRSARLPVLDSMIIYTPLSSAGFTGYARPTTITLTGKPYTLANQERVAIPITQKFTWDSIQVKINASTSVTGTTYSGFSHILWHYANDTTGVVSKKYSNYNGYNVPTVSNTYAFREQQYVATSGQTAFVLTSYTPPAASGDSVPIRVMRNGVTLKHGSTFTYSGSTITLSFPAVAGDEISIHYLN